MGDGIYKKTAFQGICAENIILADRYGLIVHVE